MQNKNIKDILSTKVIKSLAGIDCVIEYFDEICSTNSYVKDNINSLNDHYVVISNSQTAGRGRLQRSFYSPRDTGLYLSILLKRDFDNNTVSFIPSAVSVAVCRAIEKCLKIRTGIKWPNDILLNGKKVCGILTESFIKGDKIKSVIIGIGINVYRPLNGFPENIIESAGYLLSEQMQEMRNILAAEVIRNVFEIAENASSAEVSKEYSYRCSLNKDFIYCNDANKEAAFECIDSQRRLVLKTNSGEIKTISSGEICIINKNDI